MIGPFFYHFCQKQAYSAHTSKTQSVCDLPFDPFTLITLNSVFKAVMCACVHVHGHFSMHAKVHVLYTTEGPDFT